MQQVNGRGSAGCLPNDGASLRTRCRRRRRGLVRCRPLCRVLGRAENVGIASIIGGVGDDRLLDPARPKGSSGGPGDGSNIDGRCCGPRTGPDRRARDLVGCGAWRRRQRARLCRAVNLFTLVSYEASRTLNRDGQSRRKQGYKLTSNTTPGSE